MRAAAIVLWAWVFASLGCGAGSGGTSDIWLVSVSPDVGVSPETRVVTLLEALEGKEGWASGGAVVAGDTKLVVVSSLDRAGVERELAAILRTPVRATPFGRTSASGDLVVHVDRGVLSTQGLVLEDVANAIAGARLGQRTVESLGAVTITVGADGPMRLSRAGRVFVDGDRPSDWTHVIWIEASTPAVADSVASQLARTIGSGARIVPTAPAQMIVQVDLDRARHAGVDPAVAERALRLAIESERIIPGSPRLVLRSDPMDADDARGVSMAGGDGFSASARDVMTFERVGAEPAHAFAASGRNVAFVVVSGVPLATLREHVGTRDWEARVIPASRTALKPRDLALVELCVAASSGEQVEIGPARSTGWTPPLPPPPVVPQPPQPPPPPTAPTVNVSILTPGGWANIYDERGRFLGQTPVRTAVSPGPHTFALRPFGTVPQVRLSFVASQTGPTRIVHPLRPQQ